MGYLLRPRLYFNGKTKLNVATRNNINTVTPDGQTEPVNILDLANVTAMKATDVDPTYTDVDLRTLLATQITDNTGYQYNWNYFGSNTLSFDAAVVAFDTGNGLQTLAPAAHQPAGFLHTALCDCNPAGSQGTQMFTDAFMLGDRPLQLSASPHRAYSRWVWFKRNPELPGTAKASGVFQAFVPMTEADWDNLLQGSAGQLDGLRALRDAARQQKAPGLTIRYCLYLTGAQPDWPDPVTEPAEVRTKVGRVTGVIGIQDADAMTTYPGGRRLADARGTAHPYGPAFVGVDRVRKTIAIDLVTALPETGPNADRVDLGPLTLVLSDGTTSLDIATLSHADYGPNTFPIASGIVDVSYASQAAAVDALLANGDFSIRTRDKATLFAEVEVIETDQRDDYWQNGEFRPLIIRASHRGQPLVHRTVFLQQMITTNQDEGDPSPIQPADPLRIVDIPATVITDTNGQAAIPVQARNTGNCVVRFSLTDDSAKLVAVMNGFANLRVLPADDFSTITDAMLQGQAGFELIYDKVLRFYYLTYPVMQAHVDFSTPHFLRDPLVVKMVQAMVAKERWHSYDYMPRTRDLSDSRRDLLLRWCAVNLATHSAPATV